MIAIALVTLYRVALMAVAGVFLFGPLAVVVILAILTAASCKCTEDWE